MFYFYISYIHLFLYLNQEKSLVIFVIAGPGAGNKINLQKNIYLIFFFIKLKKEKELCVLN